MLPQIHNMKMLQRLLTKNRTINGWQNLYENKDLPVLPINHCIQTRTSSASPHTQATQQFVDQGRKDKTRVSQIIAVFLAY
jgi:hypothetical protein